MRMFLQPESLVTISLLLSAAAPTSDEVRVWGAGCTEKVQDRNRSELPHDGVWNAEEGVISIRGVRGEHVPFQVVVTAIQAANIEVSISDLASEGSVLPKENVDTFLQYMVKIYAPTGQHGRRGNWPDALVPLTRPFDIRPPRFSPVPTPLHQPLWIDVEIPCSQEPGLYRGEVVVSSGEEVLGVVRVELTVLDAELPKVRRFPAQMGFFYGREIARLHELEEGSEEFRKLWLEYLAFLLDYRCDPTFINLGVRGRLDGDDYVVEWTDPELERFLIGRGLSRFALSAMPPDTPQGDISEERFHAWARQYLQQVIDHARENGWYDRLVFLAPVDEPSTLDAYEKVRTWGEIVHSVDPDVPFAVTEQPWPEDPSFGSLVGSVNDWIVHGSYLDVNPQAIAERQAAKEVVTWYISCDQLYPQPNYYIDREAADPRMIGWITWRYHLGGILYWATTLWREVRDPWGDAISWKKSQCNAPAAGEGMLLYPGNLVEKYTGQENVYGPVASLRLALLREGLEELELLQVLADSGKRELADELAASLCQNIRNFTRDPNEIDRAREKLLDALGGR